MDGRDNMAQDQEMSNPIIQPVVEEFDVSQISSEINAVDAELSDAPFVELSDTAAESNTDEPDGAEPEPSADAEDTQEEAEPQEEQSEPLEADDAEQQQPQQEAASADDATESDGSEDAKPEPKPGTPDKALQKLQQRQSAFETNINDKLDQLATLLTQQSQQAPKGQDEQPPAETSEEPEKATEPGEFEAALAELNELAKDDDEFDEPTKADLSKVVNGLVKALSNLKTPEAKTPEIEGLEEVRQYIQSERQSREVKQAWENFESSHGYDGQPIWKQALQDAARIYPDTADSELKLSLAQRYFDRRVEKRDAGEDDTSEAPAKAETPAPAKKSPVKPASSKTRTPAKGTQTTPPGALGAGQAKKKTALPPIFAP